MPIHKFIHKRPRVPARPPVAVVWHPHDNQEYPPVQIDQFKWLIYAQEDITVAPHTSNMLTLQIGVNLSMGVVLISLFDKLKAARCSLMNESVAAPTSNIITTIQNNSDKAVVINKGDEICYLSFINII
jgi:hypothetical protein